MLTSLPKKAHTQYSIVNVNWFWMFINVCSMGMLYTSVTPEPPEPEEEIKPKKRLQAYLDSCSHLGITPVTYLSRQMSNKGIVMRNHSIGPIGARALAIALLVSQWESHRTFDS